MKPGACRLPSPLEADEQAALFEWAERMRGKYPQLRWMFHVPNGGSRNRAEAARLKAQGVKAGVPDIYLDIPRGGFHGLRIELKRNDGKSGPSDAQIDWLEHLVHAGYYAQVCHGWVAAASVIMTYLDGRLTRGVEPA